MTKAAERPASAPETAPGARSGAGSGGFLPRPLLSRWEPRAPRKTRNGFWSATRVGGGGVEPPRPGETGSVPRDTLPAGVLASRCARSGMSDSALALPRGLETGIPVPTQRRATWAPGSPSTVGLETRAPGSRPPSVRRSSKSAALAPVLTSFPFWLLLSGRADVGGERKGREGPGVWRGGGGAYKGVRKSRGRARSGDVIGGRRPTGTAAREPRCPHPS